MPYNCFKPCSRENLSTLHMNKCKISRLDAFDSQSILRRCSMRSSFLVFHIYDSISSRQATFLFLIFVIISTSSFSVNDRSLMSKKILKKNQNGFRRNRSTTWQILSICLILKGVRIKKNFDVNFRWEDGANTFRQPSSQRNCHRHNDAHLLIRWRCKLL